MNDGGREGDELPDGFERRFWKIVFLLNVGPVGLAVAFYLAVFRGTSDVFWASLSVGFVSLVFAAREYVVARSMLADVKDG
jgi:hypothetical protein